jgi:transposase
MDNDPKHKSQMTKNFLAQNGIQLIQACACSPDLNPQENMWSILDAKIRETAPKSKEALKKTIIKCWDDITLQQVKNTVASMPRRMKQVIAGKGGHIKY